MLGPMVNPSQPKYQMVGVFSLELARLYNYLYQDTTKNYTIVHALEGYDEISLTCDVKTFNNKGESILTLNDMGFEKVAVNDIKGGDTVESSAKIFMLLLCFNLPITQLNEKDFYPCSAWSLPDRRCPDNH